MLLKDCEIADFLLFSSLKNTRHVYIISIVYLVESVCESLLKSGWEVSRYMVYR
jgi:hypothetical protein